MLDTFHTGDKFKKQFREYFYLDVDSSRLNFSLSK